MTQKRKWNKGGAVKKKDGMVMVMMGNVEVRSRLNEYIGELFNDDRT